MSKNETICHPGVIDEVGPEGVKVRILAASACSSCHAKGACNMAEMEEKLIEIPVNNDTSYSRGQRVDVEMRISAGNRAVVLGYLLPLIILVAALIISLEISHNEGLSGLIAILVLVPYYLFLWIRRDHIKKSTQFFLR